MVRWSNTLKFRKTLQLAQDLEKRVSFAGFGKTRKFRRIWKSCETYALNSLKWFQPFIIVKQSF
ncbi:MAG: hypothetical protein EBQ94_11665 [Flavobacteriales bacterium]|nr:hypothetical protein [Crocinitomicaceae bacterium]NBX81013.1 hypothetical protein [Flavobacteriales bacterium]NCA19965.1 hypothetical protein [Crocinitomicaceae bacterium]